MAAARPTSDASGATGPHADHPERPVACCGCSACRCSSGCCSARTPTAGRWSCWRCPGSPTGSTACWPASSNQTSRLGALLDPLADRLYILATLVGLVLRHVIPLWLAVVIVGRDLVLAAALPVLRRPGYGPPAVHYLGKAATFCLLYAFPLLLLGTYHGTPSPTSPGRSAGRSPSGAPRCTSGPARSTCARCPG